MPRYLHKTFSVQELLSLVVWAACSLDAEAHAIGVSGALRIVLIPGHMGGRRVTFQSLDRRAHITDFFFQPSTSASGEAMIQAANSISGRYQGAPQLKEKPTLPPIYSLDGYLLEKLETWYSTEDPDNDISLLQRIRPHVQEGLLQREQFFDSGRGPRCHGGALVTERLQELGVGITAVIEAHLG